LTLVCDPGDATAVLDGPAAATPTGLPQLGQNAAPAIISTPQFAHRMALTSTKPARSYVGESRKANEFGLNST
jgi:hypothetical protein